MEQLYAKYFEASILHCKYLRSIPTLMTEGEAEMIQHLYRTSITFHFIYALEDVNQNVRHGFKFES